MVYYKATMIKMMSYFKKLTYGSIKQKKDHNNRITQIVNWPLTEVSGQCKGCGTIFSTNHISITVYPCITKVNLHIDICLSEKLTQNGSQIYMENTKLYNIKKVTGEKSRLP
jgi:hypothetical protein